MNTAIIITVIICATILCIFGMAFIASHKQEKDANKAADKLFKTIFDDKED